MNICKKETMKKSIYGKIKLLLALYITGCLLVSGPYCRADTPEQIISDFSSVLESVKEYDYGNSHAWQQDLQNTMARVYNHPETYAQIESLMIGALNEKISPAAKQMICLYYGPVATAKALPVMKEMLMDEQLAPSALAVLQQIPNPEVGQFLLKGLSDTEGLTKVGIVNVIALRKDKNAVKALAKLIFDKDVLLAEAAVSALGKIGDEQAAKALRKAFRKSKGKIKIEISEALISCAGNMMPSDEQAALMIFKEIYNARLSASIQYAALQGILKCHYDEGAAIIVEALNSNNPETQMLVMPLIRDLDQNVNINLYLEILPKLGEYQQMQLFSALADRKDRSVVEVVREAVYHENPDIQLAALMALRNIGTAEDVEFIAIAASEKRGRQRDMARECLAILTGKDVDQEIIAGLQNPNPKVRVEFVRSIGERNLFAGVDPVMKTLKDPDRKVRIESYKVLGKLADPGKLKDIIQVAIYAKSSAERNEAERTITLVSLKPENNNQQVEEILAMLAEIDDRNSVIMLIQALGYIGNEKALPVIRAYLDHEEPEIRIAAVKSLSVWPDATPLDDLKGIVESSDDIKIHNLAMRGYVEMIQIDVSKTEDQKSDECKHAFELSRNLDEKRIVVSGLSEIWSTKALDMAADLLNDTELRSETEAAISRMAGRIGNIDPVHTKKVLNELIDTTDNEQFKTRLSEILKWID
jgi:HEAT repeat protein